VTNTDPKPTPPVAVFSVPRTPAEEFAALKAPWQRCTWCGTTRAPTSLDAEGACRDRVWCARQQAEQVREVTP
jgi:hypothetical protein